MQISNKKGFTLIELLVVIAIIGILASIMVVSLTNAQKKARDAKRQSELNQLRTALTLYADDNTAAYPGTSGTIQQSAATAPANTTIFGTAAGNPIVPEYMATPLLTVGTVGTYEYNYVRVTTAGVDTYVAWVKLEAPPTDTWYCIDNAGKAGTETSGAPVATSTTCP